MRDVDDWTFHRRDIKGPEGKADVWVNQTLTHCRARAATAKRPPAADMCSRAVWHSILRCPHMLQAHALPIERL